MCILGVVINKGILCSSKIFIFRTVIANNFAIALIQTYSNPSFILSSCKSSFEALVSARYSPRIWFPPNSTFFLTLKQNHQSKFAILGQNSMIFSYLPLGTSSYKLVGHTITNLQILCSFSLVKLLRHRQANMSTCDDLFLFNEKTYLYMHQKQVTLCFIEPHLISYGLVGLPSLDRLSL